MGAPAMLSVDFSRAPGVARLVGELDAATVGALLAAFDLAGEVDSDWILDLAGLEFIDPVGLAGLVAFRRRTLERGLGVRLVHPRPNVARVLALTGLDDTFPLSRRTDLNDRENDFA
jgi:anti-anti-sigma factor